MWHVGQRGALAVRFVREVEWVLRDLIEMKCHVGDGGGVADPHDRVRVDAYETFVTSTF